MSGRAKTLWGMGGAIALVAGVTWIVVVDAYKLPGPGDPRYTETVSLFGSGVAALDGGFPPMARDLFTRATELIPGEPANWANLAMAEIRLGKLDRAEGYVAKAIALAPESSAVERLAADLEIRRNRADDAIAHLRLAIARDPQDLKARYALAKQLEIDPETAPEAIRELDELSKIQPDNLAVLVYLARLAVKVKNTAVLQDVVKRLGVHAQKWSAKEQEAYQDLVKAAGGGNPREIVPRVLLLTNILTPTPAYHRDLEIVQLPEEAVGEPVRAFLRLTLPAVTAASPDLGIAYDIAPPARPVAADAIVVVADAKGAAPLVLAVDGREVRRADGSGAVTPFPGGPNAVRPSGASVAVADWNSDEALDLVLAGAGGLKILKREADGSFADATAATKLGPEALSAEAFGVWAADVEMDGDLDFVVGLKEGPTLVLLNHGNGTFEVTRPFPGSVAIRAFAWADLDRDGDPDAATLDKSGKLQVFANERAGRFVERPVPEKLGGGAAMAVADIDGDGGMDILLYRPGEIVRLSDRDSGRSWESAEVVRWVDAPNASAVTQEAAGTARLYAADLDNNGAVDLIHSGPVSAAGIWLGGEAGKPTTGPSQAPALRVFAVADLNSDGFLDVAGISNDGKATIGFGKGKKPYHWLDVRPRAAKSVGDGRINSFGIGGEVQVRAGLLVQSQMIGGPTVHFGLGEHAAADVARIVWPNGTMQAEFKPKADQALVAVQRLKGSCPFIYAFDGTDVRFVTDFLWRSPLGLRINAQDTAGVAQTEDWVKIRGDQLAPRDGYYDIRMTAELWETHFWDHVSLMVVDHPEDTEVFVDERFARKPPTLAVHSVKGRHPVASAHDDQGRDVTEFVRKRDGRHLDTFGRGSYQGVTRDHWVEVEIGDDVPNDRKLVLVAEGWIHPTDSSLNVALGQRKDIAPQGLVLEVPATAEKWVEARGDIGFPAGKNKTILIDLDGVFRPGVPRKLRLRTNLEIYWDALSVATVEDRADLLKTQKIAASHADLRHRGYSLMTQADASSPEVPRYDKLEGIGQRWNDLIGFYTRFGDVRELLAGVDDRYVIANAGDEVALRFPAPAPPPSGWTRDFVLIGDGWNKDGDYNTAFSKTVLPLPSHSQPGYNTPPGELEQDPVYRRHPGDWEQYHTRYVTPQVFRDGLRPAPVARP